MNDIPPRLATALADRYRIDRRIGEGGMALVYLARDVKHDRDVALKLLRPEFAAVLGGERFLAEIKITANLQHPNILPLYDSGAADGFLYYVMPYVQGESLRELLKREHQLPAARALAITAGVAAALSFAHQRGVIHRDIKPENILLHEGQPLVADFGIALATSVAGGDRLTATGLSLGTPEYMSPEQAAGDPDLGASTDVYSLGCLLYEMLVGDPPHVGSTVQAVIAKVLTETPTPVSAIRDAVPFHISDAIATAIQRYPADRFATADEFAAALHGEGVTGPRRAAIGVRTTSLSRRLILTAGATAAALVIGGFFLLRNGTPTRGDLEADRILVMPFVSPGGETSTAAEEIFTAILHALDGAGSIRTVDGWSLLTEDERAAPRDLPQARIRGLATARRAAFALSGHVARRNADSIEVFVSVTDIRGDSTIVRSSASGTRTHAWRAGLDAANQVLPAMIGGAPPGRAGFAQRNPAAVASFLLGEAAFRRARAREAVAHYQDAVATDSAFGLAAIRGAQVAAWAHEEATADALLGAAMATRLGERDMALARGMHAYLQGVPEQAVDYLYQALARDRDLTLAWTQLGEVYTHLVIRRGRPDTLAETAFRRAQALDSGAVNVLYHLLEARYRRGEWRAAGELRRQFLAADPDDRLARQITIVSDCVERGPDRVDWDSWMDDPVSVQVAGHILAAGGAQLSCAEAAFWALLTRDSAPDPDGGKKWGGVKGLFALFVAANRGGDLARFLDSLVADGYTAADRLYSLAALLGVGPPEKADSVARVRRARYRVPTAGQAWYAGTWAAHRGDTATVEGMVRAADKAASAFEARADSLVRSGSADVPFVSDEARHARLLADALLAHRALVQGDTVEAIQRFRLVRPSAKRSSNRSLGWHLLEPLPLEQLRLAELLLATGRPDEAFEVAGAFDAPAPIAFVAFIPASLELRIRAAEVMGRSDLARPLRARLERLRRTLMAGPRPATPSASQVLPPRIFVREHGSEAGS